MDDELLADMAAGYKNEVMPPAVVSFMALHLEKASLCNKISECYVFMLMLLQQVRSVCVCFTGGGKS